jgi:hypothetical protein
MGIQIYKKADGMVPDKKLPPESNAGRLPLEF